eukprot:4404042-Prorocentrum_lima.AAC.1
MSGAGGLKEELFGKGALHILLSGPKNCVHPRVVEVSSLWTTWHGKKNRLDRRKTIILAAS